MADAPSASRPTTTFQSLVLGPFALTRDGVPIDTSRWQRRVGSLFKLLATAPNQRRPRDEDIDTIWPETLPDAGLGNLRIVAHRLRLALGGGNPTPVISEGSWIGLNPAYAWEVDLHRFERMLSTADGNIALLEEALALYRGEPFIEDRYEDWAISIRGRTQRMWRDACLQLAGKLEDNDVHDQAASRLEQVLSVDPLDEEVLRRLLEVLFAAGRRADALRRYRQFEQRLADEMGVPPSGETMAVVQRLHTQFADPSIAQAMEMRERSLPVGRFLGALPEGPLVARGEEVEHALFTTDIAESGTGRLVLLRGERGSGKTRLAQEIMLRLRDHGFLVVTGRCYVQEQRVLLYPFFEVIRQIHETAPVSVRPHIEKQRPYLSLLETQDSDTTADEARSRFEPTERTHLFWVITNLLQAIADERPLALLLDDLHAADEVSIDLVQHLARHSGGHRIYLLGTYRDEGLDPEHPLNRVSRELGREGLVERVPVQRLSIEGTAEMVDSTIGPMEGSSEFVDFVYRRTRGNPFFITAMLEAIGGRYCLIRQVGKGGMGRVFEAIDARTGDQVAAKIMFARTEADPRALQRFEQEGAVLAELHHPNIVQVCGTFLDEYANCIVMELLDGQSLGQLIRADRLSLPRIRHLAQQVTSALACAHDRGIVHRDIKPDNIMIVGNDHVKVTDFGIARLVRPKGDLTTMANTGMTIGTPLYMAPEQIVGRQIDGRADIYSLGAVLYELVTGRPPFQGDDALAIAFKHVHEVLVAPNAINPNLPDDWNALILTAMAKDPTDRFQSAAAMEWALALLGTETPVLIDVVRTEEALGRRISDPVPVPGAATRVVRDEPVQGRIPAEQRALAIAETVPEKKITVFKGRRAWAGAVTLLAILASIVFVLRASGSHGPPVVPTANPSRLSAESAGGRGPGQLEGPSGLSVDQRGNVYVVDKDNNRIQKFSPDGKPVARYGSEGTGPDQFRTPTDVSLGRNASIYVADYGNKRIVVLTPGGGALTILSHWPARGGGPETFNSLDVDSHGNVFTTDLFRDRVVELTAENKWVTQWGRPGSGPGKFHSPQDIAIDGAGYFYVVDTGNNRIEKFSPAHQFLTQWGGTGSAPGHFNTPEGLTVDASRNVYVADTKNNRVQKFSSGGVLLATYGTFGTGPGQFNQPSAVALDGHGNMYVSDYFNNRVQKLSALGKPIWGTHGRLPGW